MIFGTQNGGGVCQEAHAKKTNFATPSHNVDFM